MKSNFSRFLHHTLSHSGIREVFTSSLSLSDLIGESRSNQVANLSNLDYRVKPDNDGLCAGRSMVEMLGVLAIIGVLSVGAIAGYSKAMMKYKLNKQSEQLTQVLNSITRLAHSFNNLTESTAMFPYLIKMGEIPKDMIKNSQYTIYDAFNNSLRANIQPESAAGDMIKGVIALAIYLPLTTKSDQNIAVCQNIYNNIKENSSNIYYVYSQSGYNTDDSRQGILLGDNDCDSGQNCLKDLTVEKTYQECAQHIGNTNGDSHIVVLWKM